MFTGGGSNDRVRLAVPAATSLATVTRRSLSTETQLNGTLGYAGSYMVLGQMPGTVTWLPTAGQVIGDGQVLYGVNGAPVVLLYGATPAYRALAVGHDGTRCVAAEPRSGRRSDTRTSPTSTRPGMTSTGPPGPAWRNYRAPRGRATGTLSLGAVVFLPRATRITTLSASLGWPERGTGHDGNVDGADGQCRVDRGPANRRSKPATGS